MSESYKGYRTPKIIIGYAIRRYYRLKLSLRDINEMLLERDIKVSYETNLKYYKLTPDLLHFFIEPLSNAQKHHWICHTKVL